MKHTIIKALAAVIFTVGITSTHAADKGIIERATDKVREVVKEMNTPVRQPHRPTAIAGVRG